MQHSSRQCLAKNAADRAKNQVSQPELPAFERCGNEAIFCGENQSFAQPLNHLEGHDARQIPEKESGNKPESVVLAEMWKINDRACIVYQAKPYDGVVTDFRPMRQYAKYRPAESDWKRLVRGGYEVLTLPVYPAGMLLEPFVKHLADALNLTISRTLR